MATAIINRRSNFSIELVYALFLSHREMVSVLFYSKFKMGGRNAVVLFNSYYKMRQFSNLWEALRRFSAALPSD